jgi:DNA-binding CsgD family transcriptional regulator
MTPVALKNINSLSPREKEIAIHIVNGLSTSLIAKTLGIKSNTVSTIKNRIYIKLGVESVVDLYRIMRG